MAEGEDDDWGTHKANCAEFQVMRFPSRLDVIRKGAGMGMGDGNDRVETRRGRQKRMAADKHNRLVGWLTGLTDGLVQDGWMDGWLVGSSTPVVGR
ncbi:hypothetical protein RRF57_005391 [Xylaria bambusicola]|uniref:Uncharacterized protein n=1 Tax=Xylaria bambusicola TaxID=326684 RepID=A0AAN7Z985_9PEZI